MLAAPRSTTPPQSPEAREPSGLELVKMIGEAAVPAALSLAPREMTSAEPLSPLTVTPGSIVSVALPVTTISVESVTVEPLAQVVSAVMSELTVISVAAGVPVSAVSVEVLSSSEQPERRARRERLQTRCFIITMLR